MQTSEHESTSAFVQFLKVALIVGVLLYLTVYAFFGLTMYQVWQMTMPFDPFLQKQWQVNNTRGLTTGDDPKVLRQIHARLEGLAASSSDAKTAKFVHVVFVDFDGAPQSADETPASETGDSRLSALGKRIHRASIDLSELDDGAAVFIANRRVIWRVEGTHIDDFAKIGFEGPYAFDLEGAHPGLLAAFRIGVLGGGDTARPRDFSNLSGASKGQKRRFCEMVDRWQRYFDVPASKIDIWHVTAPGRLSISPGGPASDVTGRIRSRNPSNYC